MLKILLSYFQNARLDVEIFSFKIFSFEMFSFSELFETIASDLNVSTVMTSITIRDSEANIKEVGVGGLKFK